MSLSSAPIPFIGLNLQSQREEQDRGNGIRFPKNCGKKILAVSTAGELGSTIVRSKVCSFILNLLSVSSVRVPPLKRAPNPLPRSDESAFRLLHGSRTPETLRPGYRQSRCDALSVSSVGVALLKPKRPQQEHTAGEPFRLLRGSRAPET